MAKIEQSIDVDVPVRVAYDQWTQFESFPQFMEGVESVRQLDDTHLHWVATIAGKRQEWDAEVSEQIPDERVAWHSTSGDPNAGAVDFHRVSDGSCRITLTMDVEPSGVVEKIGTAIGVAGASVKGDLERFKKFIEERNSATGAWRGEVEGGEVTGAGSDSRSGSMSGSTSDRELAGAGTMGMTGGGMTGGGSDLGSDFGSGSGSGSGSDLGSGSGSDLGGGNLGSTTGSDLGTGDLGSGTASGGTNPSDPFGTTGSSTVYDTGGQAGSTSSGGTGSGVTDVDDLGTGQGTGDRDL